MIELVFAQKKVFSQSPIVPGGRAIATHNWASSRSQAALRADLGATGEPKTQKKVLAAFLDESRQPASNAANWISPNFRCSFLFN